MESDQNKVFVGGLAWETNEEKLKEYFRAFGDVVDAVIVKDRATGRVRGFGFVEFADLSVAEKVIHEKHVLDGRTVEVKKAVRKEDHQRSNISGSPAYGTSMRTKKIFVGGLASTVTEEDFRKHFEQFGSITDVVVMYDHSTQRPRGFGFITFDSEDAADRAVEKSFHELNDKTVEVKRAIPKELSASRQGFGSGPGRGTGYGQSNNASPTLGYGGPHYAPPPAGRPFPPYPPYGTPGYGPPGMGYGMAMNGGFGGPAYGAGPGYQGYAMGYGGPGTGYVGVPGYGTTGAPPSPIAIRSPWGHAGSGYASSGSPAYGPGGIAAYGNAGWRPGSAAVQSTCTATGYNNGGYNSDGGYNSNVGGYPARNASGGPGGYGEAYAASIPYGDSSWRSSESRNSPVAPSPSSSGAVTDPVGYGAAGRQSQRGPDARFRPYPTAGDRVP